MHTAPHGAFAAGAPKGIIRAVIVFPSLETIYAPRYLRTVRFDCVRLHCLRDGQGDAYPSVRRRSFRAICQRNEKRAPEPDARCWSRAKLAAYRRALRFGLLSQRGGCDLPWKLRDES